MADSAPNPTQARGGTEPAPGPAQTRGGTDTPPAPRPVPGRGGTDPADGQRGGAGEVYNRIAMLRVERGISRRQLAEALGVHYQTVGYLERGEFAPSLHLALRLARFFEVPVEVIFSIEPFPRLGDTPTTKPDQTT